MQNDTKLYGTVQYHAGVALWPRELETIVPVSVALCQFISCLLKRPDAKRES